eukprot:10936724-Alexandrium_andersonii.AAC.1
MPLPTRDADVQESLLDVVPERRVLAHVGNFGARQRKQRSCVWAPAPFRHGCRIRKPGIGKSRRANFPK